LRAAGKLQGADQHLGVGVLVGHLTHVRQRFADGGVERLYLAVHRHGTGTVGDPDEMQRAGRQLAAGAFGHGGLLELKEYRVCKCVKKLILRRFRKNQLEL
jgi:hypothetical protein